jgi:pimeloyl-ACP methyl ester carboxylesterase
MGGAIAQAVALIAPERVAKLVLLSTGAQLRVSDTLLKKLAQDVDAAVHMIAKWAWNAEAPQAAVTRGIELMLKTDPTVLLNDFVACDQFDVRDRVAQIRTPAMILTGSEDKMTPPAIGEWLSYQMPRGRFEMILGAGHMAMLEQPDVVSEKIGSFLFRE